ncbi:hypothetical protein [Desulfonatronovibrio hydrogenovorans]|uniref:hypothetical protein n=1 Tax=Desulfonatronovibrio hydrogenovorans TaxID=53245 RepID=UPI00048BF4CB|nr:hypothetical protein [Desulfonatronovibrio hydrogenovorans]
MKIMKMFLILILLVCFCQVALAARSSLDLPLIIENNTAVNRESWPARGGIPLPAGMLLPEDVSGLSVVDTDGQVVPAQFDPFVLWWGRDGSVKWLLVDLLVDVPAMGKAEYRLVHAQGFVDDPIRIQETEVDITVYTGPLKAVISKKRGSILEEVYIDSDGTGSFSSHDRIIRPDLVNGSIIRSDSQEMVYGESQSYNMWGHGSGRIDSASYRSVGHLTEHEYASGMAVPDKVVIEAKGPVRTTVRIEGRHMPDNYGQGIREEGFYSYTVWLDFFAGLSFINITHSLDNQRRDYPMHLYRIKECRMQFALDGDAAPSFVLGTEDGGHEKFEPETKWISLLQDSANADRWDLYNRLEGKSRDDAKEIPGYFFRARALLGPALFRGYKVVQGQARSESPVALARGDQAPGFGGIDFGEKGVSLFMQRFWVECPKAMRLSRDQLHAVFMPDFSPEQFQVHPGSRKSHELTLAFHQGAEALQYNLDHAQAFLHPLHVRTSPGQYAKSRAYPRHIGNQKVNGSNSSHWYPHYRWDRNVYTANWRTAGMLTGFNSGGMHDNYWSVFHRYLQGGGLWHWERGVAHSKWASESLPWLIHEYSYSGDDPWPQHHLVGWGAKKLYTYPEAANISGWVTPYTTNIPAFTAPPKILPDGEHLIHMWPLEWYFLTGSPIARQAVEAIGNQAKYSVHRHFFGDIQSLPPDLSESFYYNDQKNPERIPRYFYTRIYATHLISSAWKYSATGDEESLFFARWLARRILYLQRQNSGVLTPENRWNSIPPWQEAEVAIAAYALYRETGDRALLDIMGSWLTWAWHEAFEPDRGMPHRFKRGERSEQFEHHWYPGVAAPLSYVSLGDASALEMTRQWAKAGMHEIRKGQFLEHPAGQSAAYVLTCLQKKDKPAPVPNPVTDLRVEWIDGKGAGLFWTDPCGPGCKSAFSPKQYWIKYSELPIVDHPLFPDELGNKRGFYQADNISEELNLAGSGQEKSVIITTLDPHGWYGSTEVFNISMLSPGTYYFIMKYWDNEGYLSPVSNMVRIDICSDMVEGL